MEKTQKNLVIAGIIIVAIIASGLIWLFFGQNKTPKLFSVEAKTGDITEKINLTGQVKSSQGVDLAFETSGKIVANYVKTGDKIYTGQYLLAIDSSILQAQLAQAQAQLQGAQAQVEALNINTVESKTNVGLQSLYVNSLSAAQKSVSTAKDVLITMSDIQYNHFTAQSQQNIVLENAKAKAVNSLLGQQDAGQWTSQTIAQLSGGAFGAVQNAITNPTQGNIDSTLSAIQASLQDVSNLVNAMPIDPALTVTERSAISMAKTNINLEIITTSANIQSIASLKVNNSATITTTSDQVDAANAGVAAVQANINLIKTQISKTVLTALFNGQVDKDNALVGQIVSPNVPVITISNSNLEINTNIPEIDMADVKIGNSANITLDAFGNNINFPATIISVDTAPSIVNGISVYGAKLKFNNFDARIKSGMTANITVISGTAANVLEIPKSAVIGQNGKYFVIVENDSAKESREVTIGISDNQNIEIISGLKLGEKVLAY